MATSENTVTGERGGILRILAEQRDTLRITVRGINDAQAGQRTTVSDLTLGGLIKHAAQCERTWVQILTEGGTPAGFIDPEQYCMRDGETLAGLLDEYAAAARATEEAVATLADLDRIVQVPSAPWWSDPPRWSIRHILLHLVRETAQHSGHADIIRESLDGANTTMQMGADMGMEELS